MTFDDFLKLPTKKCGFCGGNIKWMDDKPYSIDMERHKCGTKLANRSNKQLLNSRRTRYGGKY